jgi:V/A-type H+-transporting ATPase subunit K
MIAVISLNHQSFFSKKTNWVVGSWDNIKHSDVTSNEIVVFVSGHDIFGKTMVLSVFPEFNAIIAFAATLLISMSL